MSTMQETFRQSSIDFFAATLRLITGTVVGVTLGLIAQELLAQPPEISLAFVFAVISSLAVIWRITKGWSVSMVLLLDLILILLGAVLRLYVMVAPNS